MGADTDTLPEALPKAADCDFHAATFERLFVHLVHAGSRVVETNCLAMGGSDCIFAIT